MIMKINEYTNTFSGSIRNNLNYSLIGLSSVAAIFSLGPLPNIGVILLLSTVIFHSLIKKKAILLQFISVSLSTSLAHLRQVHSATGRFNVVEILLLIALSSAITLVAFIPVYDLVRQKPFNGLRSSFFPLAWSTVWFLFETFGGIGRQGSWSITQNQLLKSVLPVFGFFGLDFIVASFALTIATICYHQYENFIITKQFQESQSVMEPGQSESINNENTPLIDNNIHQFQVSKSLKLASKGLFKFSLIVLVISNLIRPTIRQSHPNNTLTAACVLPHNTNSVDDYIKESQVLINQSNVLIWPETAANISNDEERLELIKKVQKILHNNQHAYIGVTLKQKRSKKLSTNEILWINYDGVEWVYQKKYVVPFAESFSTSPGTINPPTSLIPLSKEKHSDTSNFLSIHPGICFDGAFPLKHSNLIVFPALTWDSVIGDEMWELTKAHALETSSALLWCDGSEKGISGLVDDQGIVRYQQRGGNSFTAQLPFEINKNGVKSTSIASKLTRNGIISIFYLAYVFVIVIHKRDYVKLWYNQFKKSFEKRNVNEGTLI